MHVGSIVSIGQDATLWMFVAAGGEFLVVGFSKLVELDIVGAGATEIVFRVEASGVVIVD